METYGDPGFVKHVRHSPPKSASLSPTAVLQVAVAQHLGLQILRLADSWILPINTTHYSTELQSYLEKSSPVWFTSLPLSNFFSPRVEGIAEKSSVKSKIDFHKLRHSLSELREASLRLDEEKARAYWRLKKALWKLQHRRVIRHKLRKAYCKVRGWFGKECHPKHRHEGEHEDNHDAIPLVPPASIRGNEPVRSKQRIGRLPRWIEEQGQKSEHRGPGHKRRHGHCGYGRKEVIRAAKHVHDVNKRLSTFEQGFISEDGIKDREWYRHLGVAPGKWLGACWFHVRVWRP